MKIKKRANVRGRRAILETRHDMFPTDWDAYSSRAKRAKTIPLEAEQAEQAPVDFVSDLATSVKRSLNQASYAEQVHWAGPF